MKQSSILEKVTRQIIKDRARSFENRRCIKNSEQDNFQEQILDVFNLVFLTQIIYQSPDQVSFRGVFMDMTDYASGLRWEVRHYRQRNTDGAE